MTPTTIPKSLHTVTVLVAVARTMKGHTPQTAVAMALVALGYDGTPDAYQLADKAVAQLRKDAPRIAMPRGCEAVAVVRA